MIRAIKVPPSRKAWIIFRNQDVIRSYYSCQESTFEWCELSTISSKLGRSGKHYFVLGKKITTIVLNTPETKITSIATETKTETMLGVHDENRASDRLDILGT